MTIRLAAPADAGTIARIHAASWQSAYRGVLRDEFLDGPVVADRRELWEARLLGVQPSNQIVLADDNAGAIEGFACIYLDADPEWGALLDNLHVLPSLKGRGLGRVLMAEVAQRVLQHGSLQRLHLWAYEHNTAARRFYERLGGEATALVEEQAPDGSLLNAVRYCWSDLAKLGEQGEKPGR